MTKIVQDNHTDSDTSSDDSDVMQPELPLHGSPLEHGSVIGKGAVSDFRDCTHEVSERRKKPFKEKLPKILTQAGFKRQISEDDLKEIEMLVAAGATPEYVAFKMGCTQGEFQVAADNSLRIQTALHNGIAQDVYEITTAFRDEAAKGSYQHGMAYLRNRNKDWIDNRGAHGNGDSGVTVIVQTGIDRSPVETLERLDD